MGNQLPPMADCCQQVLANKPSTSLLFADDLKRLHKGKSEESQLESSMSDEMMCTLQSSDYETDDTLSIPKQKRVFIEIPESSTTSADDKFEEAVIASTRRGRCNYNDKLSLKQELRKCQIKLKHEEHEKDLLKRENDALRNKLCTLRSKCCIMESISISTEAIEAIEATEDGYDRLLSPSIDSIASIAFSSSISPRSESIYDYSLTTETNISTNCVAIDDCHSIRRIIEALKWYSLHGNNHENVYKKMEDKDYGKQIANDYDHIMRFHLENNENVQKDYDLICALIGESVQECTFAECSGYRRYLRSRNCENVHNAQTAKQHELQIYVNTMDGIHCCFIHLAKSLQFK